MYPASSSTSYIPLQNNIPSSPWHSPSTALRRLPELFFACCFNNLQKDESELDLSECSFHILQSESNASISGDSFETCKSKPEEDLSNFFEIPNEVQSCSLSKELALEQLQSECCKNNVLQHAYSFVKSLLHPLPENEEICIQNNPNNKTILSAETASYHYGSIQFESKIPYDLVLNKNIRITVEEKENGEAVIEFSEETLLFKKIGHKKRKDMSHRVPLGKDIFLQGVDNTQSRYLNKITLFPDEKGHPRCHMVLGDVSEPNVPQEHIREKDFIIAKIFQQTLSESMKVCFINLGPKEALAEKHASSGWNMALAQFGSTHGRPMGGNAQLLLKLFRPKLDNGKGEDGRLQWSTYTDST
ncbi:MAG: hypothetical protein ACI8RA_002205 [Chlamydiales bacterium]|jgi:hypothetical protein